MRKVSKPFIKGLINIEFIQQQGVQNDSIMWNWAKQFRQGNSSDKRTIRVSQLADAGFGAEYRLLNAWPSAWELDAVTQGQTEKVGETYSFAYEDINRSS